MQITAHKTVDRRSMKTYYNSPCRVLYKTKTGSRASLGGYDLIERMRKEGRLIAAWSTSTGKALA